MEVFMKTLLRLGAAVALVLLLGMGTLVAQEVVFNPGPAVTPTCWPDFDIPLLHQAFRDYAARERRFGGLVPPPTV